MREAIVEHISTDEMALSSRDDQGSTLDVLTKELVHDPVVYPVIETWVTGQRNGYLGDPQPTPMLRVWHKFAPGCWHDLWSSNELELAGMGLATIGNVCKWVADKQLSTQADAKLVLKLAAYGEEIRLPWPGMPDDRPMPLDLTELPFEYGMFLGDDEHFKKRLNRLALMRRIEDVWVPHLQSLLKVRL